MIFRRKAAEQLAYWKEHYSNHYAVMLEGPRRVGKSTIAENFARQNYRSYIKIDFASITPDMKDVFKNIADLDLFFLRLQAAARVKLYPHESVIIFDEIQLNPSVRQAIKYLVADGRYSYIETGSLLSIRKNVKNIVIPSEEHKIEIHPMDYEEFQWATGGDPDVIRQLCGLKAPVGNSLNTHLMRDFRIYMAVGGMPQAVEAYIDRNNFSDVDFVKRKILELYREDFSKIDSSGRVSMMFDDIPAQLARNAKKYYVTHATGKRTTQRDQERLSDLLNSKTICMCSNVTNINISLEQSRDPDTYRLYYADTGLFVTQMFNDSSRVHEDIYQKLLSDSLHANLGYLYENAAAQAIASSGRKLYYYTWQSEGEHPHEIDFLITARKKLIPIEVKSSSVRSHRSLDLFAKKYSSEVIRSYLFSQKDIGQVDGLRLRPLYMLPFLLADDSLLA